MYHTVTLSPVCGVQCDGCGCFNTCCVMCAPLGSIKIGLKKIEHANDCKQGISVDAELWRPVIHVTCESCTLQGHPDICLSVLCYILCILYSC